MRLVAFQLVVRDLGHSRSLLLLASVVLDGVQSRLSGFHAAFGIGQTGSRLRIVQLKQKLAGAHVVAGLYIHGFYRGRQRTVELEIGFRFHSPVGADGVDQQLMLNLDGADRKLVAHKVARKEKHDHDHDRCTAPEPETGRLVDLFCHSPFTSEVMYQSQYIGRRNLHDASTKGDTTIPELENGPWTGLIRAA